MGKRKAKASQGGHKKRSAESGDRDEGMDKKKAKANPDEAESGVEDAGKKKANEKPDEPEGHMANALFEPSVTECQAEVDEKEAKPVCKRALCCIHRNTFFDTGNEQNTCHPYVATIEMEFFMVAGSEGYSCVEEVRIKTSFCGLWIVGNESPRRR